MVRLRIVFDRKRPFMHLIFHRGSRDITITLGRSYTVVNHKVTVLNCSHFAHLISIVLRLFRDVPCKVKTSPRRPENRVFDCLSGKVKYDRNTIATKGTKYDERRSFSMKCARSGYNTVKFSYL